MAQDEYVRTALRLPPDLHKQIHESAAATGKSFNAEIIGRLSKSFEVAPGDLSMVVARLERDLASAEVATNSERLRLWMVATTFRRLLENHRDIEDIGGPMPDLTRKDWLELLNALMHQTRGSREAWDVLSDRWRDASDRYSSLLPDLEEPAISREEIPFDIHDTAVAFHRRLNKAARDADLQTAESATDVPPSADGVADASVPSQRKPASKRLTK